LGNFQGRFFWTITWYLTKKRKIILLHYLFLVKSAYYSVFNNMMQLWRLSDSSFNFRVLNKQFVGLGSQGTEVRADSNAPGNSETFEIIRNDDDPNRVRIKATNGLFLQVLFFFHFLKV
jgi:hypothetical protein